MRIKYSKLILLYALFRNLDLSLDRARWDGLDGLRTYNESQVALEFVSGWEIFDFVSKIEVSTAAPPNRHSLFEKIRQFGLRNIGIHFLNQTEILTIHRILEKFDQLLKDQQNAYSHSTENFRQEIAEFTYDRLKNKLNHRDVQMLMSIEHYLHADESQAISFDSLISKL